ncbi:MAG: RNA polymerase sigma factor [Odoribacter splanchnicus]
MEITNNLSEKALYDYKIVRNAIAGDEKAYGELFKRYKDSVYFMILKMVNNRTDAEDLMFEAFEKAFASLNYYSPQFAFSTWLFKIASNNTIDFIRKRKAQTVSLDVDDINPEEEGISIVFRLMSERRMKKRFVSNVPILCGKRSLF